MAGNNQLFLNNNLKAPCQGCVPPVRYIGCHGTCEEYKKYQAENERLRLEKSYARQFVQYSKQRRSY